jgi:hypothetical protein
MSQDGHLKSDLKGKCIPWKHSTDVRPQNRLLPQEHCLISKIPHSPRSAPKAGEVEAGVGVVGGGVGVAKEKRSSQKKKKEKKNGAKGKEDCKATHGLASASAERA